MGEVIDNVDDLEIIETEDRGTIDYED